MLNIYLMYIYQYTSNINSYLQTRNVQFFSKASASLPANRSESPTFTKLNVSK